MSPITESKPPLSSILEVFLLKYPTMKFGMVVYMEMIDYKKWLIARALQAREAKPHRRFKKRIG